MKSKAEKMLSNINPAAQKGLEIGALHNPIVTVEMGNIRYVDHDTTENLRLYYSSHGLSSESIAKIVNVDYVLGGKTLAETVAKDAPFDYVIASHVLEHIPDLIGFLKDTRNILSSGGILSLALPDKRYTFDYSRNLTVIADIIEAYFHQSRMPTIRQIFDSNSEVDCACVDFTHKDDMLRSKKLYTAFELSKLFHQNKNYMDAHCWVFTDKSFLSLITDLVYLDLFDYKIINFFGSRNNEFIVNLQAIDPNMPAEERRYMQLQNISYFQNKIFWSSIFRKIFNFKFWPIFKPLKIYKRKYLLNKKNHVS